VNTELVSNMVNNMKRGKDADTDGISAEHLLFCHPCLSLLLAKLFQLMIFTSYIPERFRYSYIVNDLLKCSFGLGSGNSLNQKNTSANH